MHEACARECFKSRDYLWVIGSARAVARKAARKAAQKALENEAKVIAKRIRGEIVGTLSKKGRSGSAIGAQLDVKVGAQLVRDANIIKSSSPKLAAVLRTKGLRLQDKGRAGRHR